MSFYDRFLRLCQNQGISPSRVAQDCGINRSSVTSWKNNGYTPRGDALQRIADYFGVSVDSLLGEEEKTPVASGRDILDEIDVAFYGDYKELTEDDKATLRDMARLMKERRAKKQEK